MGSQRVLDFFAQLIGRSKKAVTPPPETAWRCYQELGTTQFQRPEKLDVEQRLLGKPHDLS